MRKLLTMLLSFSFVGCMIPEALADTKDGFFPRKRDFVVGFMSYDESYDTIRFEIADCWLVSSNDTRINKVFVFKGNKMPGVCTMALIKMEPENFGVEAKIINQLFTLPEHMKEVTSAWSNFEVEGGVSPFEVNTSDIFWYEGAPTGGRRTDKCIDGDVDAFDGLKEGLSYVLFYESEVTNGTGILGCRYHSYEEVNAI